MRLPGSTVGFAIVLSICSAACQHGASASATPSGAKSPAAAPRQPFTPADVEFMQGMIGHHSQAIEMVKLLKTRSQSDDMKMLALRIEVSQADEIKMMRTWLADRKQSVPDDGAYEMMMQMPEHAMPGMLSQAEMDKLASLKGAEFDRLFLEGMIKHHQGAITMVQKLMASPGGGQESAVFAFASDVQSDQTTEINRMRAMRATMGK